jgi:predicted nucleic acid-binding protein
MILFFDTSALVKFFHREEDTEEEGTEVVISLDEILLSAARSLSARVINPLHGPEVISP